MEKILYAVLVLAVMGAVFGGVLAVASRVFAVKTDERLPKLVEALPGANCGGCGFAGCGAYAEAVLKGEAPVGKCASGGNECAQAMAAIMGVQAEAVTRKVAMVRCSGARTYDAEGNLTKGAKMKATYEGFHDCLAASRVGGSGPLSCKFGCLGYGSCVKACQFDAIHIGDKGVAEVDKEKCTDCGACREACPRKLIVEVPYKQKVFVNCSNKDKGPAVTKVCAASCIACGMCERTCKFDAIHVVNNVAVIDYAKCKNCTMCAKACPRNAIEPIPTPAEKEKFKAAQKAAAEKKAAAAKAAAEAAAAEAPKAE